jgi:hypothetical protein
VLHSRLLRPVRPRGRRALRAAHGLALHPRAGRRHALAAAWPVAIGATVTRLRPTDGLSSETGAAGESACPWTWSAARGGTAVHAVVVTTTPGKPRTPIPRAIVTRQTGIASWTGAPADPGVGISPAFVIRPVFGV